MLSKYKMFCVNLIVAIFIISIIGCASTSPLPSNIVFIEPPPDLHSKSYSFIGAWKGLWYSVQDTYLVVENINYNKADVILSLGDNVAGLSPQNAFYFVTADVISDSSIGWTDNVGNKLIFEIDDSLNKINGYFIEAGTDAKVKAYLTRINIDELSDIKIRHYPYVSYSHRFKNIKEFAYDNSSCRTRAEKKTILLQTDIRRYKIIDEMIRCLEDDLGWKPYKEDLKKDTQL